MISESSKSCFSRISSLIYTGINNHPSFLLSLYPGSYTIIIFVSIYICLLYYTICSQSTGTIAYSFRQKEQTYGQENEEYMLHSERTVIQCGWSKSSIVVLYSQLIKKLDFILKLELEKKCDMIRFVSLEGSARWHRLKREIGRLIRKLLQ